MDKKQILDLFMVDLKKIFDDYIDNHGDKVRLYELINSADLFVDTLKKENKKDGQKKGYKKVIEQLQKENETWTVTILGDEENKENAFGILINSQAFTETKESVYHRINRRTSQAFLDAGINFKTDKKYV